MKKDIVEEDAKKIAKDIYKETQGKNLDPQHIQIIIRNEAEKKKYLPGRIEKVINLATERYKELLS